MTDWPAGIVLAGFHPTNGEQTMTHIAKELANLWFEGRFNELGRQILGQPGEVGHKRLTALVEYVERAHGTDEAQAIAQAFAKAGGKP